MLVNETSVQRYSSNNFLSREKIITGTPWYKSTILTLTMFNMKNNYIGYVYVTVLVVNTPAYTNMTWYSHKQDAFIRMLKIPLIINMRKQKLSNQSLAKAKCMNAYIKCANKWNVKQIQYTWLLVMISDIVEGLWCCFDVVEVIMYDVTNLIIMYGHSLEKKESCNYGLGFSKSTQVWSSFLFVYLNLEKALNPLLFVMNRVVGLGCYCV